MAHKRVALIPVALAMKLIRIGDPMFTRLLVLSVMTLFGSQLASASARQDDVSRTHQATRVFKEIMGSPDQGIPASLLASAKCIAIVPGDTKFAFILGGSYGRGIATCRTDSGWSAPVFIAMDGGSVGFQVGGSSTDIVLLFMNEHALQSLLKDEFKLGADAAVAAGPVGRNAAAATDLNLNAEILSYSRSKGVFAGLSLDGAVVKRDKASDAAFYATGVTADAILRGKVRVPAGAKGLITELQPYPPTAGA